MLFCVLTVSDRCSQGLMTDTAGPAVAELLRQHWPPAQVETALVPDDEEKIAAQLKDWSEHGATLILTAGGTGMSPRDRTPEATLRVLDRLAPGLSEAIRSRGAESNPFSWLSRGVAGLRGSTLIVNLPGSKRGAEESLVSILMLLRHALEVAEGGQSHP
ncbi:MAG TPA: MogA/MoaB family molybdenum cofactor biosynthesis protein [Terracidiphilus sp.]|nr:MogA/MoaB family molybdenum cofactor biosynthesis protein [Terracidiphilus sp.]